MSNAPGSESDRPSTRVIRRHVSTPFGFDMIIEIDGDSGSLVSVGNRTADDLSRVSKILITRSCLYITSMVMSAECKGQIAEDLQATLPDNPLLELERVMLAEICSVQKLAGGTAQKLAKAFKGRLQ
ncbi:hypothetical protein AEAC466_17285 [Asticcacaulis sp. AC466]|uniref:hypothetical protein n=1 Tax=Asticcacaulis sp. AC466 TaxID=1282362 RepID=UPI0003C3CEDA|nr:hypothetical protein [Asticcacaulis sp. AC466]ESQ82376.1 hypothetical protein AEAC466_17285 [Asticcacaulis sp. AC466]